MAIDDYQNIIKLHDHIYDFRLRVGRYRIFFDYDGGIKIIEVQDESDIWFPHEVVEANVLKGDNLLKSWREYLGLPQSEAAMRAGMSQSEYAELEDQKSNPQMKTLEKLAKAFGISIEQLIE